MHFENISFLSVCFSLFFLSFPLLVFLCLFVNQPAPTHCAEQNLFFRVFPCLEGGHSWSNGARHGDMQFAPLNQTQKVIVRVNVCAVRCTVGRDPLCPTNFPISATTDFGHKEIGPTVRPKKKVKKKKNGGSDGALKLEWEPKRWGVRRVGRRGWWRGAR